MLEQLKEVLGRLKRVKLLTWLSLAIGTVILIVIGAWLSSWGFRVVQDWANLQQNPTDATKKQFDASLEIAKAIVGSLGTLATIVGGFILYLNFRVANKNVVIANKTVELTESRLITERFSKAVEQLGSDKLEVRLGGIYSLERIAKDSDRDHWTIMEVLTAFVREKTSVEAAKLKTKESFAEHYMKQRKAEGRLLLPVTKDMQAALTVIGRRDGEKDQGKSLDLSFSNLDFADLRGTDLKGATLEGTVLSNSDLTGAMLEGTIFTFATLQCSALVGADLRGAVFEGAILIFAILSSADLRGAVFEGADLRGADFTNATLVLADFTSTVLILTVFTNANLYRVTFTNAVGLTEEQLEEAKLCQTTMPDGTISDRDCKELGLSEKSS